MAKDAYYFSHDSNARNDVRMIKLRRMGGLEAIGLYWCAIEMLREAENYELEVTTIEDICYEFRVDVAKFELLFICELLTQDESVFYSNSLKNRMVRLDEIKEKRAIAGQIGGKSKAIAKQVPSNKSKVKDSKEDDSKENKVNDILLSELKNSDVLTENEEIALSFWDLFNHNLGKLNITSTDLSKAKYKTWVDPVRLMLDTDLRKKDELREIWNFLNSEDLTKEFTWSSNIRSTTKLREKFERLLTESRKAKSKSGGSLDSLKQDIFERNKNG